MMLIEITTIKEFMTNLDLKRLNLFSWYYRKDRFNNLVFLSPSLCTKRSLLSGRGNLTNAVFKRMQAKLGLITLRTINDLLLHRIQSVGTFTNLHYFYELILKCNCNFMFFSTTQMYLVLRLAWEAEFISSSV